MEIFPSIDNDKPTAGGRLIGTGVVGSLHESPPAAAYQCRSSRPRLRRLRPVLASERNPFSPCCVQDAAQLPCR